MQASEPRWIHKQNEGQLLRGVQSAMPPATPMACTNDDMS